MEGIQVSTTTAGSRNQISVIRVGGYIDTTTSSEVERALNSLLKQGRYNIIIDLSNVDYISSAGWGIFISEIKTIREHNGDLKLVGMIPDVYEIFELLEFHHILDVYDTVDEAVMKFEAKERERVPETASVSSAAVREEEPVTSSSPMTREEVASPQVESVPQESTPVTSPTSPTVEQRTPVNLARLPIEEKIRYIVSNYPELGAYRISRRLRSARFGNERISWFSVRRLLKKLRLDSKTRRQDFALRHRGQYSLHNI